MYRDAAHWNKLHVGMLAGGDWHKKQQNKQCDGTTQQSLPAERLLCGSITLFVSLLLSQ